MFQISCLQGDRGKRSIDVWCTNSMKLSLQVQKAVAKAMQTLGVMKRSFKHLSRDSFYSCTEPTSDHTKLVFF